MRKVIKIIVALLTVFSFTTYANVNSTTTDNHSTYKKTKPTPDYTIDLVNKKIIFKDVHGSYIIDNENVEVVMKGAISEKNHTVDISSLDKGIYLLEIEHKGYIFTEQLVLK